MNHPTFVESDTTEGNQKQASGDEAATSTAHVIVYNIFGNNDKQPFFTATFHATTTTTKTGVNGGGSTPDTFTIDQLTTIKNTTTNTYSDR